MKSKNTMENIILKPCQRLKLVEGKKSYEEVLDYALKFYKNKFNSVSSKLEKLYEVFGKYFNLNDDKH